MNDDVHVLLTRQRNDDPIVAWGRERGIVVHGLMPVDIMVAPQTVWRDLAAAMKDACMMAPAPGTSSWKWLILTSARTVHLMASHDCLPSPDALARLHVAVVGQATARAWREVTGMNPHLVSQGGARDLLAALDEGGECAASRPCATALLPGSGAAHPTLAQGLRARGWHVRIFSVYRPQPRASLPDNPKLIRACMAGRVRAIVATSGSFLAASLDLIAPLWPTLASSPPAPSPTPAPTASEISIIAFGPQTAHDAEALLARYPHLPLRLGTLPVSVQPADVCEALARVLTPAPPPLPPPSPHSSRSSSTLSTPSSLSTSTDWLSS